MNSLHDTRSQKHKKSKAKWSTGMRDELAFWRNYFATGGDKWPDEYASRLDPERPLQPFILHYIRKSAQRGAIVSILDVGSGPLTFLGKKADDFTIQITAVDALADEYNKLMAEYGVVPLVKSEACDVENLSDRFAPNSFHCVASRNALDHSYDPALGILQMLAVTKTGGYVLIDGFENEGEHGKYQGLHKWNFVSQGREFIIWNQNRRSLSVDRLIQGHGRIEQIRVEQRWLSVAIKRLRNKESPPMGLTSCLLSYAGEQFASVEIA